MREFLAGFLTRVQTLSGSTRRVLTAGDLALISNTWHATITTPDGPATASGTTAEVARRQPDDSWLLVIDDPAFIAL